MTERPVFDRVIVPLDGSGADAALAHAVTLAGQSEADVELVTVVAATPAPDREVYLKEVARRLDVSADVTVLSGGRPGEVIAQHADAGPAVVCMKSHARGPVTEMLLGSVAADVVRHSHQPVVLVGPHVAAGAGVFETMVVPLDGSDLSESILPLATDWAAHLGLRLWLVQVVSPDASERLAEADIPPGDVREDSYVAQTAADLGAHGSRAQWEVLHDDDPAAAIARFVEDVPRPLVAMATHGRSGLRLVTMGSVATRLVHLAPCPVAVIRPLVPRT